LGDNVGRNEDNAAKDEDDADEDDDDDESLKWDKLVAWVEAHTVVPQGKAGKCTKKGKEYSPLPSTY
jgi:hypothetical protein